jgi:hypothetical protein
MYVRTVLEILGCISFSVADERILDRDVVSTSGFNTQDLGPANLSLVSFGTDAHRKGRTSDEGTLLVHVPVMEGDNLDELCEPPMGVVFCASERTYDEFLNRFRRLSEYETLLSFRRRQLYDAFLHSYDVQQFANRALPFIGNPIIITNSDHRLLAAAGEIPEDRDDVREVIESGYVLDSINSDLEDDGVIRDIRLRRHAVITENPRFGQRWAHSIVYSHHMELGRFDVLEADRAITAIDLELIDHAGSLAGIMIERLGMAGDRVGAGSSILRDLICGSFMNERTMRAQLALTVLPLDESYLMMAVIGQRGAGSDYYRRAGARVGEAIRKCLWCVEGNVLAVLVPIGKSAVSGYDDYDRAKRFIMNNRKLRAVLENNDMRTFVSEPFADLSQGKGRFTQCIDLIDALFEEKPARISLFWEERFRVIANQAKNFDTMDMLLDKRVVAMVGYDRVHQTQYFETAIMSVSCPGSPAEAAAALNVHRNTYFYRVNKVRELFYIDLKKGEDRLAVAFTARIIEGLGDRFHVDASEYFQE